MLNGGTEGCILICAGMSLHHSIHQETDSANENMSYRHPTHFGPYFDEKIKENNSNSVGFMDWQVLAISCTTLHIKNTFATLA